MQADKTRAGVGPEDHAPVPEGDAVIPAETSITVGDVQASQGGTVIIARRDAHEWVQFLGTQPYRKTCPQWP